MNLKLQHFLMASFLYYCKDISILQDTEYDALAKELLANWDDFDHQHKYLVTKEDLLAGSLYNLREEKYPLMVVSSAWTWLRSKDAVS